MAAGSIRAGRAFVEITMDDSKLVKGLGRASRSLKRFGGSVNAISNKLLGLGAALAVPMALAARSMGNFDDEVAKAAAILQLTDKQAANMSDTMLDLAASSTFTATQVASAFSELARGGFDAAEAIGALPGVLTLARAAGADLTETTKGLVRVTRAFGLSVEELPRVIDILATSTVRSAQELEDLLEGFKTSVPLAKEAGESVETVAKAISVLANVGITGSRASTGLARIFKNLTKAATQVKLDEALGKGSVKISDAAGNIRPIVDIMKDLTDQTKQLGTTARLAIFDEVFGRGTAAAINLTAENMMRMNGAFAGLEGSADDLSKAMLKSFGAVIRSLTNLLERVGIEFIKAFEIDPTEAVKKIAALSKNLSNLIKENKEFIQTAAKTVGKLLLVALALKATALAAGILGTALGVLGFAFSTLFGLIGLGATALTTLVGFLIGIPGAVVSIGAALASIPALIAAIPAALALLPAAIGLAFPVAVIIYFREEIYKLFAAFRGLGGVITSVFSGMQQTIAASFNRIALIKKVAGWSGAIKQFGLEFTIVTARIKESFFTVVAEMTRSITLFVNNVGTMFRVMVEEIRGQFARILAVSKKVSDLDATGAVEELFLPTIDKVVIPYELDDGGIGAAADEAKINARIQRHKAEQAAEKAAAKAIADAKSAAELSSAIEARDVMIKGVKDWVRIKADALKQELKAIESAKAKEKKAIFDAARANQAARDMKEGRKEFNLDKAFNLEGIALKIKDIKSKIAASALGESAKGTVSSSAAALRQFGNSIKAADNIAEKQLYQLKSLNRTMEKELATTFGQPAGG